MRRIYESEAVSRDDDDIFKPNEDSERTKPQSARSIPSAKLSSVLIPHSIAYRGLDLRVTTSRVEFEQHEPVSFTVEIKNRYPFPVVVETSRPILWDWDIDDSPHAVGDSRSLPQRSNSFIIDRGETKQFTRQWDQRLKVSGSEWEEASLGEHTLSVYLLVPSPEKHGLVDSVTISIV